MANLITLDRAKQQLPNAATCDDGVIANLITAASAVIEQECRRTFAQASYDELLHGTGGPYLYLSNPPITRVDSIRTGQMPALYVQYADPTNQTERATIDVTDTAVVLTSIYNAVTTTTTLSFASYPTFTPLAAAINAVSGWQATLPTQFAKWRTSDMVNLLGSYNARNQSVPLTVYWQGLSMFRLDPVSGEVSTPGGFVRGYENYRVQYQGGYAVIPEDIQQATAELVQLTYAALQANPLMNSETLDKYSYTRTVETSFAMLSLTAKKAVEQHKLYRVAFYK